MFGSTMFGDQMAAPSYLGDSAPQSNYLGDGVAGDGPDPMPSQTNNANGAPNGKGIRLVPSAEDMQRAAAAERAAHGRAWQPIDPTKGPLTPGGVARPGIIPNPPSVWPQAVGGFQPSGYGEMGVPQVSDEAKRWARFGVIDNAVLAISALAGFSLDDIIAKRIGAKGYGVIVGALVGNAISDGVAAVPEGGKAAMAVTAGALLPIIPVGIAMVMGKELKGKAAWAVGLSSLALLALSFRTTARELMT